VLRRVHGGVVERVGVRDEGRERVRQTQVDDRLGVRLDDCVRSACDSISVCLRRNAQGGTERGRSERRTGDLLDLGPERRIEARALDLDERDGLVPRGVGQGEELGGRLDVDGQDVRVGRQVGQGREGLRAVSECVSSLPQGIKRKSASERTWTSA